MHDREHAVALLLDLLLERLEEAPARDAAGRDALARALGRYLRESVRVELLAEQPRAVAASTSSAARPSPKRRRPYRENERAARQRH